MQVFKTLVHAPALEWQFIDGSRMRSYYVYIMASKRNGTLYMGSTVDFDQMRLGAQKQIGAWIYSYSQLLIRSSGCRGQAAARRWRTIVNRPYIIHM